MNQITYILHYENALGEVAHYVGNTARDRLKMRMREHRKGKDTPRTKLLRITHGKPRLAAVVEGAAEGIDRFINASDTAGAICPICKEKARKTVNS